MNRRSVPTNDAPAPEIPPDPLGATPIAAAKYRLQLTKTGTAAFLGHLEFANVIRRALRCAGLPLCYSEGYHPHAKVSFGKALPVGIESECEFCDVELTSSLDSKEIMGRLASVFPDGIKIVSAGEISRTASSIERSIVAIKYGIEGLVKSRAAEAIAQFETATNVPFVRLRGAKAVNIDLKNFIAELVAAGDSMIGLTLNEREPMIRVSEALQGIFGLSDEELINVRIKKTKCQMNLIVNVTLGETRVARLENGVVAELFIERAREQGVVGNIYKGKVVRVLPGMQAAFVDIGLERTAFLHASDVVKDLTQLSEDELRSKSETEEEGEDAVSRPARRARPSRGDRFIENMLQEGKDILVQVEKEPMGTKGARLTSHLSLPGRYLVYMPTVNHIGVSRRIADATERQRLKQMIGQMGAGSGGFIVRTVSEGVSEKELKADVDYLTDLWKIVEKKAVPAKAPALVHSELDVLSRVVRDHFTPDIDRLVIDSSDSQKRVKDFVTTFMPHAKNRVELYGGNEPIFDAFGIEIEITRALGQKVWLKSGGYIIIEQTEALTAIDVNTGRFVGRRNVEDTIFKTNLEAVKEIVYQLRLRNIGGIIIIDFIDMERPPIGRKFSPRSKKALKPTALARRSRRSPSWVWSR